MAAEALTFGAVSQMNASRSERWHGPDWKSPDDQWTIADWSNAVAGEAGELANLIKKMRRLECAFSDAVPTHGSWDELLDAALDEAADVVLYLDLLVQKLGGDLGAAVRRKFNRKSEEQGFEERL